MKNALSRCREMIATLVYLEAETVIEATYKVQLAPWWSIQPDVQYIAYPLYDEDVKNNLIFGVHFEIGHLFDW